jgi:hypothetical protein
MPLTREESTEKLTDHVPSGEIADGRRVVCENGVCRFVDEPESERAAPNAVADSNVLAVDERLKLLGATQIRVERGVDGDDSRAACLVPVVPGSKVLRRFEAVGASDSDVIARLVEQIESWLQDRQ